MGRGGILIRRHPPVPVTTNAMETVMVYSLVMGNVDYILPTFTNTGKTSTVVYLKISASVIETMVETPLPPSVAKSFDVKTPALYNRQPTVKTSNLLSVTRRSLLLFVEKTSISGLVKNLDVATTVIETTSATPTYNPNSPRSPLRPRVLQPKSTMGEIFEANLNEIVAKTKRTHKTVSTVVMFPVFVKRTTRTPNSVAAMVAERPAIVLDELPVTVKRTLSIPNLGPLKRRARPPPKKSKSGTVFIVTLTTALSFVLTTLKLYIVTKRTLSITPA